MINTPRMKALNAFVAQHSQLQNTELFLLAGDASFRKYYRVTGQLECGGQATQVLVDAPPPESLEPFVSVALAYAQQQAPVPEVLATDAEQGIMLLEDLGDTLLLQTDQRPYDRYVQAIELLPKVMATTTTRLGPLPPYDRALLERENALFTDWLLARHLGIELSKAEQTMWQNFNDALVSNALMQPQAGVHRDYHSRNIMVRADQELVLIDFQDAVMGPVTYDLVSLLRDCYVRWPDDFVESLLAYAHELLRDTGYIPAMTTLPEFTQWFDWMGLQRHTKASGIFARLYHRDGKQGYLNDIPLTLQYIIDISARYESLRPYSQWLEERIQPALLQTHVEAPQCAP